MMSIGTLKVAAASPPNIIPPPSPIANKKIKNGVQINMQHTNDNA